MNRDLSNMRVDYTQAQLEIHDLPDHPLEAFESWFQAAKVANIPEPNAMALATVDAMAQPSVRMVLLKGVDSGFVFFTNYESRKAQNLQTAPNKASLLFFWQSMERQIRVEGVVEFVDSVESDTYFQTRERDSRIGAWASPQSQEIPSREYLDAKIAEISTQFDAEKDIPRPPHWGGFRLMPHRIEFWQGRRNRLHDRIVFELNSENLWTKKRLAP